MAKSAASWVNDLWRMTAASARLFGSTNREGVIAVLARANVRLSNLHRLITLAQQYEDECLAAGDAASLSGLLLWLQDLAGNEFDTTAAPAVDADQVLPHRAAKGLEWPIVVLCDPASEVRDRLWDIQAESLDAIDVGRPLHRRFIRYWPWAFGQQRKVPIAEETAALPVGLAAHADAIEENMRLLNVSMTRARELMVLARQQKNPTGEWMDTVVLGDILPERDGAAIELSTSRTVPLARWHLVGEAGQGEQGASGADLAWFDHIDKPQE